MQLPNIVTPGRNCWRSCSASRLSVLVDADAYYRAFASAAKKAQQSIVMLGWDMNSRVELVRPDPNDGTPYRLGPFLDHLVRNNSKLDVHILEWDFALVFALEREMLPRLNFGARTHRRVHFHLDAEHPTGASHHQKVVVIDDSVAFVGGLDFAEARWDTPGHSADNPLRKTHEGKPHPPFHDVQVAVDGDVAKALGELARERWYRATGKRIHAPTALGDRWPDGLDAEITDIEVGIARTEAAYEGRQSVREVEQLYLDAIAAARKTIYVESQYLTSRTITEALLKKLREDDGPEIMLLLPSIASGWLEENTMSILRGRILRLLAEADTNGRLRVYCPANAQLENCCVNVHAKVLIIDDRLLRIGSSNLSNRSMGLDSECDLVWEGRPAHIAATRHRLLAEHLHVTPEVYAKEEQQRGMLGAIDALKGEHLRPLENRDSDLAQEILPNERLVDPVSPLDVDLVLDTLVPEEHARVSRAPLWRTIGIVVGMLALAAAWRWTPLRQFLDPRHLAALAAPLRDEPLAWVIAIGVYLAAGLLSFPLMLLLLQGGLIFGAGRGILIALVGATLSAAATYGVGKLVGRSTVEKLTGKRLRLVVHRLRRSGVIAVISVRLVPIAPFSIVNVIAGATGVRFSRFMLGNAIGLLPGIIAINLFGSSLFEAIANRDPAHLVAALAVGALLVVGGIWVRRRLDRRVPKRDVRPEPRAATAGSRA